MTIWHPKKNHVLTRGRAAHAAFGAALPVAGHWIGGYDGGSWGLVAALFLGIAWEVSSPILGRILRWEHPYADRVDLLAFVAGAMAGAIVSGCL